MNKQRRKLFSDIDGKPKKKEKVKFRNSTVFKVYRYFLPNAWKKYPGYFVLRLIKLVVGTMAPFIDLLVFPKLVDELLGEKRIGWIVAYVAISGIGNILCNYINTCIENLVSRYAEKFNVYYKEQASLRIMELDFKVTEDKKALDQIELARTGMDWYSGGLDGIVYILFAVVQNIITILGISAIVLLSAPWLLLVIFGVLAVTGYLNQINNRIEQEEYRELSKANRIFSYLGWQLVDFRYGKDIRLYNAKNMFLENFGYYSKQMTDRWKSTASRQLIPSLLMDVTDVIRDFGSYFYIGALAVLKKITIGTATQLFEASASLYGNMRSLVGNIQEIFKRTNYAYEYVKFMDFPEALYKGHEHVKKGPHVFEFKDVEFAYPGSDVKVLKGVNLKIEEGEHLSIVGLNGAGKTTFVKLLCRLYDPTSGTILMDGKDIREYEYNEYMQEFAPVFQDFKLFAFTIEDNILLMDANNKEISDEDKQKTMAEVLEKVGLSEKVASLENGVKTYIFKHYDKDGIEPSGGEQQKLAIGRALYKDSPVVILDEPTAALDPIAEYEIYKKFEELVGGKTAVYISHRLSSCQFCDKIAVFSEGVISEYGTHAALLQKGGLYAQMFEAQAEAYVH